MDSLTSELLIGYTMAGVGGIMVIRYLRRLYSAWGSQEWLTTSGKVIRSGVVRKVYFKGEGGGLWIYRADISYSYRVEGIRYKSDRPVFGQETTMLGSSSRIPKKLVARWPAGMTVTVYYDAADPTDATLDPKSWWRLYPRLVIALAFTLAGISLLAWSFK